MPSATTRRWPGPSSSPSAGSRPARRRPGSPSRCSSPPARGSGRWRPGPPSGPSRSARRSSSSPPTASTGSTARPTGRPTPRPRRPSPWWSPRRRSCACSRSRRAPTGASTSPRGAPRTASTATSPGRCPGRRDHNWHVNHPNTGRARVRGSSPPVALRGRSATRNEFACFGVPRGPCRTGRAGARAAPDVVLAREGPALRRDMDQPAVEESHV